MYSIIYNPEGKPLLQLENDGLSISMFLDEQNINNLIAMLEMAKNNLERLEKSND